MIVHTRAGAEIVQQAKRTHDNASGLFNLRCNLSQIYGVLDAEEQRSLQAVSTYPHVRT